MAEKIKLRDEWLDGAKTFAFPCWKEIGKWVDASFPKSEHRRVYSELARDWVERIAAGMPVGMDVADSEHFVVAVPRAAKNVTASLAQLEDYRRQIRESLAGLPLMEWPSKSVVLIVPDQETFTRYLADYYDDGEYMLPGGVCLRRGYIHFVLPDSDLRNSGPVLAHELCHVCLTGIPWPLWVEEAVVQTVEHQLSHRKPYQLNQEMIRRHRRYWNPAKLQSFWEGRSFHFPDEGSELSYHLARFLLEAAGQRGRDRLMLFLKKAHHRDAGFDAMHEALNVFPNEIVRELLGTEGWQVDGKTSLSF